MQAVSSNWAYCVVLGTGDVPGTTVGWMDIPLKHHRYFHPYGKGWPVDPPNYMAFRWKGHVRVSSITSIELPWLTTPPRCCRSLSLGRS
jgi:hypothetical protein